MAQAKFSEQLRQIAGKNTERLEDLSRLFTLDLFDGVILDTRVDTGRLRGNWQASVGRPASGAIDAVAAGGSNADRLPFVDPVANAAQRVEPLSDNFLTNNLPYAEVWEQRDAMVGRAVARVEQALRTAASKV